MCLNVYSQLVTWWEGRDRVLDYRISEISSSASGKWQRNIKLQIVQIFIIKRRSSERCEARCSLLLLLPKAEKQAIQPILKHVFKSAAPAVQLSCSALYRNRRQRLAAIIIFYNLHHQNVCFKTCSIGQWEEGALFSGDLKGAWPLPPPHLRCKLLFFCCWVNLWAPVYNTPRQTQKVL